MEGFYTEKYSFVGEWHDPTANLTRTFYIFFFPYDNSLEMFDLKTRKTFVRRIKVDGINLSNFYMGASVNILGRIVKISEYACEDTRKKLSKMVERTFALIKPIPTTIVGDLINDISENGFTISKIKKTLVTAADVMEIYKDVQHESYFPFLVEYLSGKHVYGLELVGENAVEKFKEVAGDTDPQVAAVGTLRRKYGTDIAHNSLHVALSAKNATENIEYFFPPPAERTHRLGLTATLKNCTCCIIKPHALKDGKVGAIIKAIAEADFEISALNMYYVEMVNAGEFLEVYKGVLTEYKAMVDELASGPCIAMEIVSNKPGVNTPYEFRQLVGPSDPEIARYLRPNTLRAKFGKTKIQNAVHCSDLPEDGLLEVEYFFKILYL